MKVTAAHPAITGARPGKKYPGTGKRPLRKSEICFKDS